MSSDGCWVAVGQAAAATAAAGPGGAVGPDGGAAVVLFNAGLNAELVIETAATSINRWDRKAVGMGQEDSNAVRTCLQELMLRCCCEWSAAIECTWRQATECL